MIIYEEILKDFQNHKVRYILVGGIAINLHGAFRNTADLDILVEMSDDNLTKIVSILKKQGYKVRQPIDPMKIADTKTREIWIRKKHMKAFNFYKDKELKEVAIIIDSPVSYEAAAKNILWLKAEGIDIPLISIDHLIKMKQKAGRPIDKLDIKQLNQIKKMGKKS